LLLPQTFIALNGLSCADVPLRNYSLTHWFETWNEDVHFKYFQLKSSGRMDTTSRTSLTNPASSEWR